MGFNAILISPIMTTTDGGYTGLWPKNFSEINPHFGT